tara:strand:- start:92 stop:364 length:273 start_codon:yes stop_codon:yes gene_type:complete
VKLCINRKFIGFAALELVRIAIATAADKVLDIVCRTGVATLTAARTDATVTSSNQPPKLVKKAKFLALTSIFTKALLKICLLKMTVSMMS